MKQHPPLGTPLFTSTWENDEIAPVSRSPFVVWLPDGRVCTTRMPFHGVIQVQDIRTGQEVQRFEGHQQQALEASNPAPSHTTPTTVQKKTIQTVWSPDRRLIASEIPGDRKRVWEVASGKEVESAWSSGLPSPEYREIAAWSPDGHLFASFTREGGSKDIKIYELASGRFIGHQPIQSVSRITSLAWSPDGQWIAMGNAVPIGYGRDLCIKVWEAATGRFLLSLSHLGGVEWVTNLAWSPDGHLFAHASDLTTLILREMPSGTYRRSYEVRGKLADMLKWSPDGRFIAFSTRGYYHYKEYSMISVWEVATGEIRSIYHGHQEREQGLGPAVKWVFERKKGESVEQEWSSHIQDMAWSPDGKQIASVGTFWLREPHSVSTDVHIWQAVEED